MLVRLLGLEGFRIVTVKYLIPSDMHDEMRSATSFKLKYEG